MFPLNRDKQGSSAHLPWRVRLFWIGAVLAMVGIYLERSWLVWAAIVVLLAGISLRFVPASRESPPESGED